MTRQVLGQELAEKVRKLLEAAQVPGVETKVTKFETNSHVTFDSTSAMIDLGNGVSVAISLYENHKAPA